jgi:hypothetical protein
MLKRRCSKQTIPLKRSPASFAKDMVGQASLLPPGPERDDLLRRASRADTASHLDDWAHWNCSHRNNGALATCRKLARR